MCLEVKGIVHPKITILSLITYPYVLMYVPSNPLVLTEAQRNMRMNLIG